MINTHRLALFDDEAPVKVERQMSEKDKLENRTAPRQEGLLYNPIVHLDLSLLKKHNSLMPLKKQEVSNIEVRQGDNEEVQKTDLLIIKLKSKDSKDKKVEHAKTSFRAIDKEKPRSLFLKRIEIMLESSWVMTTMAAFTIFALFSSDIQTAWLPSSVDFSFDVVQTVILFFFTLEIVLASIAKRDYLWSFFFWIDVVATISLIQDISFIFDYMLTGTSSLSPPIIYSLSEGEFSSAVSHNSQQASNSLQKVSSASRATRVLRIIRIIRLIRIVKLYKSAVQAREKIEKQKREKERLSMTKEMQVELSVSAANSKPHIVNSEVGDDNAEAHSKLVESPALRFKERMRGKRLSRVNLEPLRTEIVKKPVLVKKKKTIKRTRSIIDSNSTEQSYESKISKVLSESLTKKVIILILAMLIILPILQDDFYKDDSLNNYSILAKYIDNSYSLYGQQRFDFSNPANQTGLFMRILNNSNDPHYPIVAITIDSVLWYRNSSWDNYAFRSSETYEAVSSNGVVHVTYSSLEDSVLSGLLNIVRTVFVCICLTLAAIYFEQDTQSLVLQPLEVMIEIVGFVAKDPIGAKNVENLRKGVKSTIVKMDKKKNKNKKGELTAEKYEIKVIESAIIKISALLAIGFGDAGGEIIKENLSSASELNPMLKGKKKVAIFGFCDIRNFPSVNEALQEKTMLFVNEIAEIVHSSVDRFAGAANKNIGDAFLMVWKFPSDDEVFVKKETLELDSNCQQVQHTADMSVLGFLDVIIRINRDARVLAYRTNTEISKRLHNYQVKMGFGLHLGWAIEGAIGSSYKIDASYLSPNVNMAARLEAATRIYGVNILISGPLYDKLSEEMKDICRLIDVVTVKGSIEPIKLYTIDLNLNLRPQSPNKNVARFSAKMQRIIYKEKKEKIIEQGKVCGSIPQYVLSKKVYLNLLDTGRDLQFYDDWEEGFEFYIQGQWDEAAKCFNKCLAQVKSDGPCTTLLGYLKAHNYTAPSKWNGVRELTSKT